MKNSFKVVIIGVLILILSSCGGIPEDALRLTSQSLDLRQMQQKEYSGVTEEQTLIASSNVLQDIGYIIKESEPELGMLLAEKDRTAVDEGQVAVAIFLAVMTGQSSAIDDRQKIRVSLITRSRNNKMLVRVSFQRVVWNNRNQISRLETIKEKEIYKDFFNKLDKSIFLIKQGV